MGQKAYVGGPGAYAVQVANNYDNEACDSVQSATTDLGSSSRINGNTSTHTNANDRTNSTLMVSAFAVDEDGFVEAEELNLKRFIERKWCWSIALLFLLGGGGAVGLAVALSPQASTKSLTESPAANSTIQPRCTLCFGGMDTPVPEMELGSMLVEMNGSNATCASFRESQSELLLSDSACEVGQSLAWKHCGCPSAPFVDTSTAFCQLCPRGAPPVDQSDFCVNENRFVAITGSNLTCQEVVLEGSASCECPTEDDLRVRDFQSILEPLVSNTSGFGDTGSARYRALRWLALEDGLALNVSNVSTAEIVERYVMTLLYFNNGGPSWTSGKLGFLLPTSVCSWDERGTGDNFVGIGCNDDALINYLDLCKCR